MTARDVDDHLRGIHSCNDVLASLTDYPERDEAIARLERAITIDRLAAALAARELAEDERDRLAI
jgi:hypothetical protein